MSGSDDSSDCRDCIAGQYSVSTGASACIDCAAEVPFSDAGATTASACYVRSQTHSGLNSRTLISLSL